MRIVRRVVSCCAALTLAVLLALGAPRGGAAASAQSAYVDGISDQSLPAWDSGFSGSYFASLFRNAWVTNRRPPIRLARYVVQWNVMSGRYSHYSSEFDAWLADVRSLGLTPDVGVTSFDGVHPASSAEYRERLEQLLSHARTIYPIRYLEPWNEPNDQGGYWSVSDAAIPAHFTDAASSLCASGYGCTIIAGNVQDSPNAGAYIAAYWHHLKVVPSIWGVHPYYSVAERSEAPLQRIEASLPHRGAGQEVWFTEVAARKCTNFNSKLGDIGESGQAERAKWLVDTLIPRRKPRHVFYYGFLMRERRAPSCIEEHEDDALYIPSADPNAPDLPRPAAAFIFGAGEYPVTASGALASPNLAWGYATEPLLLLTYAGG